ncbi:MAG: GntR family transcriptional regulator [Pseudomonadota bacterium]
MATKHEEISSILIEEILSGRYRPGDRLPSERDLAARFTANRGAVREAMKRLEQLGLAQVQPGGARVQALEAASLDIVGHLLQRGSLPDAELVDEILQVMAALMRVAAESAVINATAHQISELRRLVAPLAEGNLDIESHQAARLQLLGAFMQTSGNLVCQLIARTLLEQLTPRMAPLRSYAQEEFDIPAYAAYYLQLDQALATRDIAALRVSLQGFTNLNRETIMRAFLAAKVAEQQPRPEAAAL